jgi:hypothetical protein
VQELRLGGESMGHGRFAAFAALLVATATGCGGALDATGGADASTDGRVSAEVGDDAAEAGTRDVCGAFFDAFVACEVPLVPGGAILSPLAPASEVARIRGRYETVCAEVMALPGTVFTASAVAACTAAIQSEGCLSGEADPACSFSGTSTAGLSCVAALKEQCGEGCVLSTPTDAGTFTLRPPCPLSPIDDSNNNACGPRAICVSPAAPQIDGGPRPDTCIAVTIVGAGQGCAAYGELCDTGTYCWSPSGMGTDWTCTPAGNAGDSCPLEQVAAKLPVTGSCAAPLFCSVPDDAGAGTCQTPGGLGASCQHDSDCAAGLGCVPPTAPPPIATCRPVTFVAPGETCGGSLRCLQGDCIPSEEGGTCSAVIADGQPCQTNTGAPCDVYATCVNGTCTLGYPMCP